MNDYDMEIEQKDHEKESDEQREDIVVASKLLEEIQNDWPVQSSKTSEQSLARQNDSVDRRVESGINGESILRNNPTPEHDLRISPEQLSRRAKEAEDKVNEAISQLSREQQAKFAELPIWKNGCYTEEGLQFIKENCSEDAYRAAQEFNTATLLLNLLRFSENTSPIKPLSENQQDTKIQTEKFRMAAKEAELKVNSAIAELTPEQQAQFAELKDDVKTGLYTKEQLQYIKENCPEDAYAAARNYNNATHLLNSLRVIDLKLPPEARPQSEPAFDKITEPLKPLANQTEKFRMAAKEAELKVNSAIAELTPEQQAQFAELKDDVKTGLYTKEQLQYIKENCPEDAYAAARNYNNATHLLNSLRVIDLKLPPEARPQREPAFDKTTEPVKPTLDKLDPRTPMSASDLSRLATTVLDGVETAIGQLNRRLGKVYSALQPNTDGTLSNDQLKFIKQFCSQETSSAAEYYNQTVDMMNNKRERLAGRYGRLAAVHEGVLADIGELPLRRQLEFAALQPNRDGTFSNEQLNFIKHHCGPSTYTSARYFNTVSIEGMDKSNEPAEVNGRLPDGADLKNKFLELQTKGELKDMRYSMSKPELTVLAAKMLAQVESAVRELPLKLQFAYAELHHNKGGTLSNKQLEFIKQFCANETYGTAAYYNRTVEIMNTKKYMAVPIRKEGAQANGEVVNAAVATLNPRLQMEYAQLQSGKDGGFSPAQLEFIKANCGKEAASAAQSFNDLNQRDSIARLGDTVRDFKWNPEKMTVYYDREMAKAKAVVDGVLSDLSPEQRAKFDALGSGKTAYSKEQLAFLKQHDQKAYIAAAAFNSANSALYELRINQAVSRINIGGILNTNSIKLPPKAR